MAYSEIKKKEIFIDICLEITKGKSLRNILKEEGMPSTSTFFVWLAEDEEKSKQYARACDIRAEVIFDEMLDIADDNTNDYVNSDNIQRSRLRVDTRKWMLSKLNPKKYSDKLQTDTNITGDIGIVWKEEKTYESNE